MRFIIPFMTIFLFGCSLGKTSLEKRLEEARAKVKLITEGKIPLEEPAPRVNMIEVPYPKTAGNNQ